MISANDHRMQSFYVDGHLVTASFQPKRNPEIFKHIQNLLLSSAALPQIRQASGLSTKLSMVNLDNSKTRHIPPNEKEECVYET